MSLNGRIAIFQVDKLNLEFAATLDIAGNPYKKLLDTQKELAGVKSRPPPRPPTIVWIPREVEGEVRQPVHVTPTPPSAAEKEEPVDPETLSCIHERRNGTTSVGILSMKVVTFEFVDYHGRKTTTAEKHLEILFRLSNASQTAKLYYRSWRGHTYDMMAHTYNGATLKDNLGNTYKLVPGSNCDSRPSNNSVDKTASINPGKAIVATLVFEVPVESARTLTQLCGSTEFHAFRYHPKLHHSQTSNSAEKEVKRPSQPVKTMKSGT